MNVCRRFSTNPKRYVMTSTVAPRLRVDNNVRVFTYYGG
jgi:hypothetical protein